MDTNRVAVLLNIAAVAMARKQFGTATRLCSRALVLEPRNVKALLRRAKANMGTHELRVNPIPVKHEYPCSLPGLPDSRHIEYGWALVYCLL